MRGADGRVNPGALAAIAKGGAARTRPAQEPMAQALHEWADRGVPGLVEAPTGTGKSYAALEDSKQGAVPLLCETGRPIAQVAREPGVNEGPLGDWRAPGPAESETGSARR